MVERMARWAEDNIRMPFTLKTINAELAKRGFKATLVKGDGYFCFLSKPLGDWIGTVRVPTIHAVTVDQWIEEFKTLLEKNRQPLGRVKPAKSASTRKPKGWSATKPS